jgi:hypothetical protein
MERPLSKVTLTKVGELVVWSPSPGHGRMAYRLVPYSISRARVSRRALLATVASPPRLSFLVVLSLQLSLPHPVCRFSFLTVVILVSFGGETVW